MKAITSFIERLTICWKVLTLKNYIYFGTKKNPIVWDENGKFVGLKSDATSCYWDVDESYKFYINGNEPTTLNKVIWNVVEQMAKNEQEK